jgi:hypothetical protein
MDIVKQLKLIQFQGYKFLESGEDLYRALDSAYYFDDLIVSLVLRPDKYVVIVTAKAERLRPFEPYVQLDFEYAEIVIPKGKNNEAIAKIKFEIDNLPARIIDFPAAKSVEEQNNLSIYKLKLEDGKLFIVVEPNRPAFVAQDDEKQRKYEAWLNNKEIQQFLDDAWESWLSEKL